MKHQVTSTDVLREIVDTMHSLSMYLYSAVHAASRRYYNTDTALSKAGRNAAIAKPYSRAGHKSGFLLGAAL